MPETPNKPTILVTGSSGLIGTRLCRALSADYRVLGFDFQPPEDKESLDHWIECDLTSDESVEGAFGELAEQLDGPLASVVHLAAYYDFSGEPSPVYDKLTVEGTRRMLRGLQKFDVEQFVFSSSLLVMKPVEPGQTLHESSETQAEWAYPQSKLDAEEVIQNERGDMHAVILRVAGVYDQDCHSLPISQQIRRIYEAQMESHFFPGDQDRGQAFVHLDDVIDCFRKTIEARADLEGLETFLVAESEVMSYGELQNAIGQGLYDEEWTTVWVPKFAAKAGAWVKENLLGHDSFIKPWMVDMADAHYPVDITKAEKWLKWRPQHRLRDDITEICKRLREDPHRWYEVNNLGEPPVQTEAVEHAKERDTSS